MEGKIFTRKACNVNAIIWNRSCEEKKFNSCIKLIRYEKENMNKELPPRLRKITSDNIDSLFPCTY